jgi:hypothetical protein
MMRDLLLPTTDAGVAMQAVVVAVLFGALLVRTRHDPDLRLLVAGGTVFVAGLFMLRAAH